MCEMSQKRPLIRSTLVLAFERGKEEEEEFKEKESKKKINALRLSSIIFVVALVYVVYVVVVNSLEDNWEEFCLLFLCLTSLKKTREATPFLCSRKKRENTNNLWGFNNNNKTNYSPHHKSLKAKKKTRKKENERRGSGNVWRGFRRRFRRERYGREIRAV